MDANIESLYNLEENLQSQGYDLMKIPYVLQLNKRDLSNIVPAYDLAAELQWIAEGVSAPAPTAPSTVSQRAKRSAPYVVGLIAGVALGTIGLVAGRWIAATPSASSGVPIHAVLKLPAGVRRAGESSRSWEFATGSRSSTSNVSMAEPRRPWCRTARRRKVRSSLQMAIG